MQTDIKIIEKESNEDIIHLDVEGEITMYTIGECRDAFLPYIGKSMDLTLNFSKVKKIDTAGFQLLLAIGKEMKNKGGMFALTDCSDEVDKYFKLFGEQL